MSNMMRTFYICHSHQNSLLKWKKISY